MNGLLLWMKVENFSSETKQSMNLLSLINLLYVTLIYSNVQENLKLAYNEFVSFSMARAGESLHLPNQNVSG